MEGGALNFLKFEDPLSLGKPYVSWSQMNT